MDTILSGKCLSSNFNFDIHWYDKVPLENPFLLEIYLDLDHESYSSADDEAFKKIGWIDFPIDCLDKNHKSKISIHEGVLSFPLYKNSFHTVFSQNVTEISGCKFYICLQAVETNDSSKGPRTSVVNFAICRLTITNDEEYASRLRNIILIKSFESDISRNSHAKLEITGLEYGMIQVENILLSFLYKGFNYQETFSLTSSDTESKISLSVDNKEVISESLNIFKRFVNRNILFSTCLYTGRKKVLKTSNARLELPDLNGKDYKPKVISIKRFVNFKDEDDMMIVENGLDCSPTGPLYFEASLFIKPLRKTGKRNFYGGSKDTKIKEVNSEIYVKINHFSNINLREIFEKGEYFNINVSMGTRSVDDDGVLDICLELYSDKMVRFYYHMIKYCKL